MKAQGCEIVKAPYAEGALRVATVRDPAGNVIGIWQDGTALIRSSEAELSDFARSSIRRASAGR